MLGNLRSVKKESMERHHKKASIEAVVTMNNNYRTIYLTLTIICLCEHLQRSLW